MRQPAISFGLVHALFYFMLILYVFSPVVLAVSEQPSSQTATAMAVDPDKIPSEMNHHIAGVLLIAIALSMIGSESRESLSWMRWLSPALFIAGGVFLAVWSDSEIWPRGARGLSWLLYHDPEARQHKLYALLLLVIGIAEAIQAGAKRRRFWLSTAVTALCLIGAVSLLFHDHGAHMHHAATAPVPETITMPDSLSDGPFGLIPTVEPVHEHMHSSMGTSQEPMHHHEMTGAMEKVKKQHMWFAVVGFFVVLFKFLYDVAKNPAPIRKYLWASSVLILGVLLLSYTE